VTGRIYLRKPATSLLLSKSMMDTATGMQSAGITWLGLVKLVVNFAYWLNV